MMAREKTSKRPSSKRRRQRDTDRLGRPTGHVFSLALVEELCEHLRAGLFIETASQACGISSRCVQTWLARGRQDLDAAEDHHARTGEWNPSEHAKALIMIEAARVQVEADLVSEAVAIGRAGDSDDVRLRAITWYLERLNNKRYGRGALRVDVDVADGASSEDLIDMVLARISRVEGTGGGGG